MRSLNIPRVQCWSTTTPLEERSSKFNKAKEKVDAMEVLFEYRGSRRQLTASSGENIVECVTTELHRIGRSRAQIFTANVDLSTVDRSREIYLLQKWSPQWECYLDVHQASEISDGDRLAVVIKPKPPSKFLLLCCCCSGIQNEPQVQGIPRSKKNAVRKNEEIQALDYMFNVESGRQSRVSEAEKTQSPEPSEAGETDLNEGEQYVRAESGRASWKLVPTKSSDDLREDAEPQPPAPRDLEEPTDTQERESDTPPHPPEMINGAAEPVEGSSEQAAASTGHEGEGEEEPMATATQPGEEKEKVTEEKSPGDNSVDNQPTENAEGNARVTEENSDHEDKGDLNDPSGELMTTGAETSAVDEQDASGEVAELSRNGEITEVGEVKEEIQQESVNDDETKAQAT